MSPPSQRELDHQYRMSVLQSVQQVFRYVTYCVIAFLVTRYLFLSIRELAGRQTNADILVKAYADLRANKPIAVILSWLLTASATAWGFGERRARKRVIERLHPKAIDRQMARDPNRGTSGITSRGDTRPGDL